MSSFTFTVSSAGFYIYLIHIFPSDVVGSIALFLAILSLLPILFSLGLTYGWQHFVAFGVGSGNKGSLRQILGLATRLGLLLSVFSVIFLFAIGRYFADFFFHSNSYLSLIYLLSMDLPPAIILSFFNSVLLGAQRFKSASVIAIIYTLVLYAVTISLIGVTHSTISIPIGWCAGYSVGAVLYYAILRDISKQAGQAIDLEPLQMKHIFSYSLPLYLTGILGYGSLYVDRLTVALFKNLSSIGIYNLALLISSGVLTLKAPLGTVIFSKFSEFFARKDFEGIKEVVRVSTNLSSFLFVPAALGMVAISVPIVKFLAGKDYISGALPLTVILLVNGIFVFGIPVGNALRGVRKTSLFLISSSLALLSNFILSILLIPRFDLAGAAIAYSSTTIVNSSIVLYFAKRADLVRFDYRFMSRLWLSAFFMAILVYVEEILFHSRLLYIPLYIVSGIVIFLLMIRITSTFTENDKDLFALFMPLKSPTLRRLVYTLLGENLRANESRGRR